LHDESLDATGDALPAWTEPEIYTLGCKITGTTVLNTTLCKIFSICDKGHYPSAKVNIQEQTTTSREPESREK
jgi:hypothetical protein